MLNYYFSEEELDAMAVLYADAKKGFAYLKLLKDIDSMPEEPGWVTEIIIVTTKFGIIMKLF